MTSNESHWRAELEGRLIEMFRREHTLEEMARELSLPLDIVHERLRQLMEERPNPPRL